MDTVANAPQSKNPGPQPWGLAVPIGSIDDLCRRHNVEFLDSFVLYGRDDGEPGPDNMGLIVEFIAMPGGDRAAAYLDLYLALEKLLGRRPQLVSERAEPTKFVRQMISDTRHRLFTRA